MPPSETDSNTIIFLGGEISLQERGGKRDSGVLWVDIQKQVWEVRSWGLACHTKEQTHTPGVVLMHQGSGPSKSCMPWSCLGTNRLMSCNVTAFLWVAEMKSTGELNPTSSHLECCKWTTPWICLPPVFLILGPVMKAQMTQTLRQTILWAEAGSHFLEEKGGLVGRDTRS